MFHYVTQKDATHTKNTEYTRRKLRDVKIQVSLQKECRKTKSEQKIRFVLCKFSSVKKCMLYQK